MKYLRNKMKRDKGSIIRKCNASAERETKKSMVQLREGTGDRVSRSTQRCQMQQSCYIRQKGKVSSWGGHWLTWLKPRFG